MLVSSAIAATYVLHLWMLIDYDAYGLHDSVDPHADSHQ